MSAFDVNCSMAFVGGFGDAVSGTLRGVFQRSFEVFELYRQALYTVLSEVEKIIATKYKKNTMGDENR